MSIEWNKVTWYSKVLAVVLAVLIFYVGFTLGIQKKEVVSENKETDKTQKETTVSVPPKITSKKITEENFSGSMPVISGSSILAKESEKYINQSITEFKEQADRDVPEMRKQFGADSPTASYTIDIDAKYIKGSHTESIVISTYAYTGGANGNSSYKVITSALSNPKIISLRDVIKQTEQSAFTEFVKKQLNSWHPDGDNTLVVFPDDVKSLTFASFSNWSIDDKNLIIYFDKYAIGPGALGSVAFPIPLANISNFLNSAYLD